MTVATEETVRLNIGAGDVQIEGFTPIDRKFGQEAYPLDYPDGSVDEIRASHVLEHFSHTEVAAVLTDWVRALKPGGTMWIAVPNILAIAELAVNDGSMWEQYAMGGHSDGNDYHKAAFTPHSLEERMGDAGLIDIEPWYTNGTDTACIDISLNMKGSKPGEDAIEPSNFDEPKPHLIQKNIHAVLSCPRLIFSDMLHKAAQYFMSRKIPFTKTTGCFWEKQIDRGISEAVDAGADYIFTMDYDTVFDDSAADQLMYLLDTHPEADAIAPLQMKRESETPMIWKKPVDGRIEFKFGPDDPDLIPIEHAHFGLTIIRASAIKKMERPYFHSQPGKNGTWDKTSMDADIYFWEQFKKAGNKLFLASHVCIGHLQMVATWPGEDFKPLHQYAGDFNESGAPEGIRK